MLSNRPQDPNKSNNYKTKQDKQEKTCDAWVSVAMSPLIPMCYCYSLICKDKFFKKWPRTETHDILSTLPLNL